MSRLYRRPLAKAMKKVWYWGLFFREIICEVPKSSTTFHRCEKMEDLAKPEVRMPADATQGGANEHLLLTVQPKRTSLSDCLRVPDLLEIRPPRNRRGVCALANHHARTGTRHRLNFGANRNVLRRYFGEVRRRLGWPKLGKSSERCPPMVFKTSRGEKVYFRRFTRRYNFPIGEEISGGVSWR